MTLKKQDEKTLAKRIIISSLNIERSLGNLLKVETNLLKRKSNVDISNYEIAKLNRTIKHILYYLITIDDRIQKCFDIIINNKEIE